jgi:phage shock protein E
MVWMSQLLPTDAPGPLAETAGLSQAAPASAALPAGALLLDVRSYAEFMGGHLPGAHSLPLPLLEREVMQRAPDREAPVVLYCSTGARSEQALGLMQQLGYHDVHNGGAAVELARRLGLTLQRGL